MSDTRPPIAPSPLPGPCWVPAGDALLRAYHDHEWGRPVVDEDALFEHISLEAFQSGLSWRTVFAKRPAFRAAFAGFDPDAVAAYDESDVARLLFDAGIVRNRRKVEATITNARAVVALRQTSRPLPTLVWSHRPKGRPRPPRQVADVTPTSPEGSVLARELKSAGFVFVGPTTVHATLQACGLRNDHLADCPVRAQVAAAQAAAHR